MLSSSKRMMIGVCMLVLLVCAVALQVWIDPQRHQFEPKLSTTEAAEQQLPVEFALGAATGFREAVAGMLWVRCDEFFHDGNYDAILPMIRIITWLDPHNIEVYETGAWHMDYNFTDADQRSDRRYIPMSVALLKEAIANNLDDSDLYAELAYTHFYRKVEDFNAAAEWFEKGQALAPKQPDQWDVTNVGHGLAHTYEALGELDKAIAEWKLVVAEHKRRMDEAPNTNNPIESAGYNISRQNLKEDILRDKWRKTMVNPPLNVGFDATITRIAPMQFVVSGTAKFMGSDNFVLETGKHTWVDEDGCRIEVRLQDAGYQLPTLNGLTLATRTAKDVTIMQDAMSIRSDKFNRKYDLSRDHSGTDSMYSFTAPRYTVTLWFNPGRDEDSPPNIADRIGYRGEGISPNEQYVDTTGVVPGTPQGAHQTGFRFLKKTFVLTRDDIMGQGIKSWH